MGVVSFILVHPDRRATRGRKQTFMHIKNLFYAWLWQLKIVHLKEPIDGHELPPKTCDSSDYNVLTYIFTLIRKVNSIRSCRSVGTYMTVNKPEPPQFPNKTKLYLKRVLLNLFHSWRALTHSTISLTTFKQDINLTLKLALESPVERQVTTATQRKGNVAKQEEVTVSIQFYFVRITIW